MLLIALWLVAGFVFGLLGCYISGQKNRPVFEGLAMGFLFGPLGVLVAALLPTIPKAPDPFIYASPSRSGPKAKRDGSGAMGAVIILSMLIVAGMLVAAILTTPRP